MAGGQEEGTSRNAGSTCWGNLAGRKRECPSTEVDAIDPRAAQPLKLSTARDPNLFSVSRTAVKMRPGFRCSATSRGESLTTLPNLLQPYLITSLIKFLCVISSLYLVDHPNPFFGHDGEQTRAAKESGSLVALNETVIAPNTLQGRTLASLISTSASTWNFIPSGPPPFVVSAIKFKRSRCLHQQSESGKMDTSVEKDLVKRSNIASSKEGDARAKP